MNENWKQILPTPNKLKTKLGLPTENTIEKELIIYHHSKHKEYIINVRIEEPEKVLK